jgi:hypothetical protein
MSKHNRTADAIRRVELSLPAALAYRLAKHFVPESSADREFLAHAKTVFNAVVLEPVEGLPRAKVESHVRSVTRLQAELLDQYEGRGAVTVYAAMHMWLQDLADRGLIEIDPEGAFVKCWEALGEAFAQDRSNVEAWERCQRSAGKMFAEWGEWLSSRGYYNAG